MRDRTEYSHRYYQKNRERILAQTRAYKHAHRQQEKERLRRRHQVHLAEENARSHRWRLHHAEQCERYQRAYRHTHAARRREYSRRYYQAHRERILESERLARRPKGGETLEQRTAYMIEHPEEYIHEALGIELRPYQLEPLDRILDSIENHRGDTIVLMFPRQSGKDELLLDFLVYLADLYSLCPAGMVVVNPTFRPQTATMLERFDASLKADHFTRGEWRRQGGFLRMLGQVRISFLSGEAHAKVAGATASLLLVVNEAQDIAPKTYHQKFVPMAASMNATRILAGTAWTSQTLLAQEMRLALQAEKQDGRKRVFTIDADGVRESVPWYGKHVDAIVAAQGRQHPLVKTQYFNEEIDAEMGMFNAARMAMIASGQLSAVSGQPEEGKTYAFCIDVGGMESPQISQTAQMGGDGQRDATTLSIVEVDLSTVETLQAPTYRVVHRRQWTGLNHLTAFGQVKALAERWRPQHIVIDATGVGEGLWAMLDKALPGRVMPVKFSAETKSEIGYRFLSIIETGRFRDCSAEGGIDPRTVAKQYAACRAEVLPGPRKTMRWGVPEGTRDENGALIHDDIVLADALVAELDTLQWTLHFEPYVIQAEDPLKEMSKTRGTWSEIERGEEDGEGLY